MLRLATEPEWLGEIDSDDPDDPRPFLLPGVRVRFAPIGIKAVRAARDAVREALGLDEADMVGAGDALSAEIIRRGVCEWEGVGDRAGTVIAPTADERVLDDDGKPVLDEQGRPRVRRGTISAFVADPDAFEAADRVYVGPWARRDTEGNGSAGSPSGTGAEATPAPDTASSLAKRKARVAARNAATAARNRRQKKAS